ncbi:MAG: hypothetical protein ACFFE8_07245 [Candidatus Heimdallarchaeota archaeon]
MKDDLAQETRQNKDLNQSTESTKKERLSEFMIMTLRDMFNSLRYPKFRFTRGGVILVAILGLVSSLLFILDLRFTVFSISPNLLGIPISIIVAFIIIYIWFIIGTFATPRIAHYLIDNKALRLLFTRGDVHYMEFVPYENRRIGNPQITTKFISLLIAWVSVSAFLLNLLSDFLGSDPRVILNATAETDIISFILRFVIILILVPLVFSLIYPVGWMLIDANLKAYNSAAKLNWFVGAKVLNITAGIITAGSVVALGANVITDFGNRIELIGGLVVFCIVNVSLMLTLIVLFYNIFFQGKFYQLIVDSIEVGYGVTSVTLTDDQGQTEVTYAPPPVDQDTPKEN